MKSKLLIFTIIIAVMISICALPAFAAVDVVEITRPEGNEVVTKDLFSIFGTCIYDETTISFEYFDQDAGDYKPLKATDGSSTFKVGSGKMFGKDIKLKYKGDNDIKITAYTNTKESKDDPQILTYTITLGEDNKNNSNWFEKALDWITGSKDSNKKEDKKD
ncbi:MAG: hypothetical protein K0R54_1695 [Clostridiaceae bacterium]|jgi:hypothetical protein|nr:hypothetical protein [Clostridiaceae bacterium]